MTFAYWYTRWCDRPYDSTKPFGQRSGNVLGSGGVCQHVPGWEWMDLGFGCSESMWIVPGTVFE